MPKRAATSEKEKEWQRWQEWDVPAFHRNYMKTEWKRTQFERDFFRLQEIIPYLEKNVSYDGDKIPTQPPKYAKCKTTGKYYCLKQIIWDTSKTYQKKDKSVTQSENEVFLQNLATKKPTLYIREKFREHEMVKLLKTMSSQGFSNRQEDTEDDFSSTILENEKIYVNLEKFQMSPEIQKKLVHLHSNPSKIVYPAYFYVFSNPGVGNLHEYTIKRKIDKDQFEVDLTFRIMLGLARQAINAIFHLHSLGIAHRNVFSRNFLVMDHKGCRRVSSDEKMTTNSSAMSTDDDNSLHSNLQAPTIKLCNFSYAKIIEKGGFMSTAIDSASRERAPEVGIMHYNENVDIWGLGTVLYSIFIGQEVPRSSSQSSNVNDGMISEDEKLTNVDIEVELMLAMIETTFQETYKQACYQKFVEEMPANIQNMLKFTKEKGKKVKTTSDSDPFTSVGTRTRQRTREEAYDFVSQKDRHHITLVHLRFTQLKNDLLAQSDINFDQVIPKSPVNCSLFDPNVHLVSMRFLQPGPDELIDPEHHLPYMEEINTVIGLD